HVLARPRAHGVHGHDGLARGGAVGTQGLDDEQLRAREPLVLARGHHGAHDARELHGQPPTSTVSTTPTRAAATGQSFRPEAMRAEEPETMRTRSRRPASTVSTATR